MIRNFGIALCIILLSAGCANNSKTRKNDSSILASKFQSCIESEILEQMPSILVSINAPDLNINWSGCAGLADVENKVSLTENQTFRIASVTKTFVAATILRLWEDGKLKLDDSVAKYISEKHSSILKKGGYNPEIITIRNLLNHSSGMAEHVNSPKYQHDFLKTRHVWTRTETLEDLIEYSQPVGQPGEQFSYSDTGYILLGEVIESITGKTMGDAISEQLKLHEQGMLKTCMENFDGDFTGQRIHQYYQGIDTYNYHPSLDYYGGGGLLSTTSDLCLFCQNLFHQKVFKQSQTLDTMLQTVSYQANPAMDYGMGIWRIELSGLEAFTHTGFWGTQVVYVPKYNLAMAVNYSQRWTNKGAAPVLEKLIKIIINENKLKD